MFQIKVKPLQGEHYRVCGYRYLSRIGSFILSGNIVGSDSVLQVFYIGLSNKFVQFFV